MRLSEVDIKDIITTPRNPYIKDWRAEHEALEILVNGGDVSKLLSQVKNYENAEQKKLRDKVARSTADTVSYITKPLSKVFTATGSKVEIKASNPSASEKFTKYIEKLPQKMSIKKWMQDFWKEAYITDPNAVVLIEAKEDGMAYPTYKSISVIRDYLIEFNKIEYLVIEHGKREVKIEGKDAVVMVYRVLDDKYDALYFVENNKLYPYESETEQHSVPNTLGRVPAVVVSDIIDKKTGGRKSFLSPIVELLKEYLRDSSVHSIYKFLHGYPIFWHYASKCTTCEGEGKVRNPRFNPDEPESADNPKKVVCPTCKGKRLKVTKDVSDGVQLPVPTNSNAPILAPNIAGYIQPDLSTWKAQVDELREMARSMHFSIWGTHVEDEKSNTATGRYIDAEPVNDVLRDVSDTVEKKETEILSEIAAWSFPGVNEVTSTYGKRFMIETPDALWEKYIEAKQNKAPISSLDKLYKEYLAAEYHGDSQMLEQKRKEFFLEPFPHYAIGDLKGIASQEQMQRKLLYSDWMSQDIDLTRDFQVLQEEFNQYVIENAQATESTPDPEEGGGNREEGTGET